jgi:hypothetical protein
LSKGRAQGDDHGEEALRRCGRGDEGGRYLSAVGDRYRDTTATRVDADISWRMGI